MESTHTLFNQYTGMVQSLAIRLHREYAYNSEKADLVAFGYGGLFEAGKRFDPSHGVQFQTFAYHRIRGAILDGIRRMTPMSRRAHQKLKASESDRIFAHNSTLEKVAHCANNARKTNSFPALQEQEAETPEALALHNESVSRLTQCLSSLAPRERALVQGFYIEGRRFDEIAKELGISRSWASRLHSKALAQLREEMEENV